ncbi:MAG: GntR family transcriptional regulator [Chloroflexi bacterium]|nr:MAG: GntR family transcriptional regulator [Chloroflexota bacterium]TME94161.1 MAG: GntR family transcriptional regulator [Chloroflexota bacterium]
MTSEESIVADALVESLRALHRDDPAPVYVQIERRIRMGVADGTLQPGDHLPSVRDLARQLGLSPNTVGRAYAELSREGVIMARAGGGSEIAARDRLNQPALLRTRLERLRVLARQMAVRGLALGLEPDEIAEAVRSELAAHGRPISGMPIQDSLGEHEAPLLSARNRLRGRVAAIRAGELLAEVTIELREGAHVVAAVTRSSVDRLGLDTGAPVSVYVKATELTLGV